MKNSFKFIFALPVLILSLSSFNTSNVFSGDECEIVDIYEGITPETDAKALTSDGLKKLTMILKPAKIKSGKYSYQVKRIERDLYKVVDKELYIETKYCNKYAYRDEATLVFESNFSRPRGKIFFK